jgi:uncharacterized repeat protein (TIGR01451 family)
VTNSVLIRSATTDPNTGNNTGQIQTTVTCPTSNTADVGVSLAGPASVTRGQNLTYTAIVTNGGPSTAQSVQFSLPVPSNLYYVSSSGGNCSVSNGQFTCQMGDMTSGQTTSIQIIFNSQTVTPCSQATLTAQGTVTASTSDPNNSNNTSQSVATTLTCNGGSGTVSVYKTDNRSEASTGDRLRYSIVLTNSSSVSANNVSVTDSVPSGLSIVSVSDGGYINGQTVTWNNISVGANSSRTLYVDADVNSSISDGTVIRNTVYANGQSSTDDTTIRGDGYNDYYDYNNSNRYRYYYQSEPVYYQSSASTNPTVTYPSVVLPQTGDRNAQSFGKTFDNSKLQPATVNANEAPQNAAQPQGQDSGFSAVFYATLVTLFAVGSAAASRMISGML